MNPFWFKSKTFGVTDAIAIALAYRAAKFRHNFFGTRSTVQPSQIDWRLPQGADFFAVTGARGQMLLD